MIGGLGEDDGHSHVPGSVCAWLRTPDGFGIHQRIESRCLHGSAGHDFEQDIDCELRRRAG